MVHKQPMSCDAQLTFLFGGIFQGVNVREFLEGNVYGSVLGNLSGFIVYRESVLQELSGVCLNPQA